VPLSCPAGYQIEHLNDSHIRQPFSCGKVELDLFISQTAGQSARKGTSATHVIVPVNSLQIVGYVSLASAQVPFQELPTELAKPLKLPKKGLMPATLLGRIAVDAAHQKRGLGSFLMHYALDICSRSSLDIGSSMVVLDALDNEIAKLYASYGFVPLVDHPLRMVLPMATIRKLLDAL
jgi:predicted GNAT family N-acyltransferase